MQSITTDELEWCANWVTEQRYYCTVLVSDHSRYSKPRGVHLLLEELFGVDYGGFRYNESSNGVEVWFRKKEDMLTFKMLTQAQYTNV